MPLFVDVRPWARHRGMTVGILESKFAKWVWALWGESQVSNDFPKIVDKIPDDRGWNRGKPGFD